MPAELSSDERFKHSSPAYQSAVLHTTSESASDGQKDDGIEFYSIHYVLLQHYFIVYKLEII